MDARNSIILPIEFFSGKYNTYNYLLARALEIKDDQSIHYLMNICDKYDITITDSGNLHDIIIWCLSDNITKLSYLKKILQKHDPQHLSVITSIYDRIIGLDFYNDYPSKVDTPWYGLYGIQRVLELFVDCEGFNIKAHNDLLLVESMINGYKPDIDYVMSQYDSIDVKTINHILALEKEAIGIDDKIYFIKLAMNKIIICDSISDGTLLTTTIHLNNYELTKHICEISHKISDQLSDFNMVKLGLHYATEDNNCQYLKYLLQYVKMNDDVEAYFQNKIIEMVDIRNYKIVSILAECMCRIISREKYAF